MNEYIVPIVQDIEFGNFSVIGECVQIRQDFFHELSQVNSSEVNN